MSDLTQEIKEEEKARLIKNLDKFTFSTNHMVCDRQIFDWLDKLVGCFSKSQLITMLRIKSGLSSKKIRTMYEEYMGVE
jgi:hypothetical protein